MTPCVRVVLLVGVVFQWEIVPGKTNICRPKGEKPKPESATSGAAANSKQTNKKASSAADIPGKPVVVEGKAVPALEITMRHHFSSKLQRMSTVARTQVRHGLVELGRFRMSLLLMLM